MSKVKFTCRVCAFPLTRDPTDLNKDCPKCFQPRPYVDPATKAAASTKAASLAPSSAMESQSGSCAKAPTGQHAWKFGKCSHCGKAEGKLASGTGTFANPGGANSCSGGGKCMFMFGKCKKCGRKEC